MKEHHRRRLLLKRIHPASIAVKGEVTWPIPRRHGNKGSACNRRQFAGDGIEGIDIDPILSQVGLQHEAVGRVSVDHVGMRLVMAAEGKTARRTTRWDLRSNRACILVDVRSRTKRSSWLYGQHGYRPAGVISNKDIFARPVDTQVSWARSF